MKTIYTILKLIVFPGAYLRGFWEQLTCRILKIPVESQGYIRPDESCGHVEHSFAKSRFAAYLVATGPGFMNFCIGLFTFLYGFMNIRYMGITVYDSVPVFIISIICIYLGVSALCCLFPLTEDILNYKTFAYPEYEGEDNQKAKTAGKIIRIISYIFLAVSFVLFVLAVFSDKLQLYGGQASPLVVLGITSLVISLWIAFIGDTVANKRKKAKTVIGGFFGYIPITIAQVGAFLEEKGFIFIFWIVFLVYQLVFKV